MIIPVIKFVVFSLAPFLLLLWLTSPDLWLCLSSSARLVCDNPSSCLHLPASFLILGEALAKSLTCDNLDLSTVDPALLAPGVEKAFPSPSFQLENSNPSPLQALVPLNSVPSRALWLLTGLMLMGLNAYFPQLSLVSFLWSPLREANPVLHWMESWWFVSPGWEQNLVSLAPFLTLVEASDGPAQQGMMAARGEECDSPAGNFDYCGIVMCLHQVENDGC
ncbi:hypothetical protein DSO57_1037406 [Entomophthora muscae]|uniref:Uncharacterized protein n=1 Tax=Entomophthora muscae TaxID=34485 RepID=A0ACC2SZ58_9FUNG|nr:hypothetical protein DSO57_1037406 [Entomophthora muscae]